MGGLILTIIFWTSVIGLGIVLFIVYVLGGGSSLERHLDEKSNETPVGRLIKVFGYAAIITFFLMAQTHSGLCRRAAPVQPSQILSP